MKLHAMVACFGILSITVGEVWAEQALGLSESVRLAEGRAMSLMAQDKAADAAKQMAVSAGHLPDPMLELGLENLPISGPSAYSLTKQSMTAKTIGLSQAFPSKEKRMAKADVFEQQAQLAGAQKAQLAVAVRTQTALSWLTVYYQQQIAQLLQQQADYLQSVALSVSAAYRGGKAKQSDVFSAELAVTKVQEQIAEQQNLVKNSRILLSRWVGERAFSQTLVSEPVLGRFDLPSDLLGRLSQQADIQLMTVAQSVAQAQANVARQEKQADWTWSVTYGWRAPEYGDMVTVGVSIPLQWNQSMRQDREWHSSTLKISEISDQKEEALRELRAQVLQQQSTVESNRQRLQWYADRLVPLAEKNTLAAQAEYAGAKGELATIFAAKNAEVQLKIEQAKLSLETAKLWAMLNYLLPT